MAALSNYLENALLDHVLGNTTYTQPGTIYVALYTSAPSDSGGGTEVSGGAYARQAMSFNNATSGSTSNSAEVAFPTATANWGSVTHVGLMDASTGGNLLFHGALTQSKTVSNGDTFKFNAGSFTLTMD